LTAIVAILGPGDFFGEMCLTNQSISIATAICLVPATLITINKKEMIQVLSMERSFSDHFISAAWVKLKLCSLATRQKYVQLGNKALLVLQASALCF
jgi:CRP-like cAMP-binding protein